MNDEFQQKSIENSNVGDSISTGFVTCNFVNGHHPLVRIAFFNNNLDNTKCTHAVLSTSVEQMCFAVH